MKAVDSMEIKMAMLEFEVKAAFQPWSPNRGTKWVGTCMRNGDVGVA